MEAAVGDRIVVAAAVLGGHVRDGEILARRTREAGRGRRGSNMNEIVVGVDLSPSGRAALAWAAEQARATGEALRAIHALDISPAFTMELGMGTQAVSMDAAALDAAYRDPIASTFEAIRPEPSWHLRFSAGGPGPVLVAESEGAALIVVGTQDHVGIGRLVPGSVSHYCINHARRLVVAVPAVPDPRSATLPESGRKRQD